jgi:hypothetical protein
MLFNKLFAKYKNNAKNDRNTSGGAGLSNSVYTQNVRELGKSMVIPISVQSLEGNNIESIKLQDK